MNYAEAVAKAWEFFGPKLPAMFQEKGAGGVWTTGFRSGWDAASRLNDAAPDLLTTAKDVLAWMNRLPIPTEGCLTNGQKLYDAITKADGRVGYGPADELRDLQTSIMACATMDDLRSVQITIQRIREAGGRS